MRKLLTASLATAALGAATVAEAGAQTAQDTLGRVLEGLQGGQDQRRAPEGYRDDDRRRGDSGYRDDDRRRDERDMDRRGAREGDDRRPFEEERRRSDRGRR